MKFTWSKLRQWFQRIADEQTEYTRAVLALAIQFDLKPSVALERFGAYCEYNQCDWRDGLRLAQESFGGMRWMLGKGEDET